MLLEERFSAQMSFKTLQIGMIFACEFRPKYCHVPVTVAVRSKA
jgi:hypothetical protein